MAVKGVSTPAVVMMGAGGLFLWSGLKGAKISTAARSLLQGQQPAGTNANPISGAGFAGQFASGSPAAGGGAPAAPASITGNVATGKFMATAYGWGSGAQWNALYALWQKESGWSNTAQNASSGAYGIAQALGHGPTNQYPAGPANPPTSSASAQIAWGLSYIKQTYGSPVNAWAHEQANNWY
jgi:hypothetical protein